MVCIKSTLACSDTHLKIDEYLIPIIESIKKEAKEYEASVDSDDSDDLEDGGKLEKNYYIIISYISSQTIFLARTLIQKVVTVIYIYIFY
jgi:Mg2+ and Co2+ transporter CorA